MIYYKIKSHSLLYIIIINHDPTPLYLFWSFRNVGLRDDKSFFGPQGFRCRRDLPPWSTQAETQLRDLRPDNGASQSNRLPVITSNAAVAA